MNREIKFRAWFPSEGKMYGWDDFKYYRLEKAFLLEDDGDPKIAMQYTGLKDKNGKEIYEGDILNVTFYNFSSPDYNCKRIVGYENGTFTMYSNDEKVELESDRRNVAIYHLFAPNVVEIIGNVHENPEML